MSTNKEILASIQDGSHDISEGAVTQERLNMIHTLFYNAAAEVDEQNHLEGHTVRVHQMAVRGLYTSSKGNYPNMCSQYVGLLLKTVNQFSKKGG